MLAKTESALAKAGTLFLAITILSISTALYLKSDLFWEYTYLSCIVTIFAYTGIFVILQARRRSLYHKFNTIQLTEKKRKKVLLSLFVLFMSLPILVTVLKLSGVASGANFYDFHPYYNGAERVRHGHPLFAQSADFPSVTLFPDSPNRYLYAPITVLIFLPFTYLEPATAAVAWTVTYSLLYLFGLITFYYSLEGEFRASSLTLICAGAISFGPFITNAIAGQVSALLSAFLSLGAASLVASSQRRRSIIISSFSTLVVAFKAFYAPVGAVLLRDRRRLLDAMSVGILLSVSGVLLFGFPTSTEFIEGLLNGKGWGESITAPADWNLNSFHPLYLLGPFRNVVRLLVFVGVTGLAIKSRSLEAKYIDLHVYSLGVLAMVLASPTVSTFELTSLSIVILFLFVTTYGRHDGLYLATAVAAALIHVHPYTIEFLVEYFAPFSGFPNFVHRLIPLIQPAVWGSIILVGCILAKFEEE